MEGAWSLSGRVVEPTVASKFESDLVPGIGLELARLSSPPRISPDSSKVAYLVYGEGGSSPRIAVRNLESGKEQVLRGPDAAMSLAWSRDSRDIVSLSGSAVEAIDVMGGRPRLLGDVGSIMAVATGGVDRDSGYLFSRMRGSLERVDMQTGALSVVMDAIPGRGGDWVISPEVLPNGEHVIFSGRRRTGARDAGPRRELCGADAGRGTFGDRPFAGIHPRRDDADRSQLAA